MPLRLYFPPQEIQEQWFLVNIVNNDYKNPPWLWDLFETVMAHPDFDVHARGSTLTKHL